MENNILLVDARNLMYRAIFANKRAHSPQHAFTVMLRFMCEWLDKFKPSAVHMFWDSEKAYLWRRRILPTYKQRVKEYEVDIRQDLVATQAAARALLPSMGVRQFYKRGMEADDLIFAACKTLSPQPVIIVSSDADYQQAVFNMPHVRWYNPMEKTLYDKPEFDPAIQKALAGDRSDNVEGYYNIGPVKGAKMAASLDERWQFLREAGVSIYIRNLLLIDLSLCPDLLKNLLYVQCELLKPVLFDKHILFRQAKEYKVSGFVTEFDRLAIRFKHLVDGYPAATTNST